MRLALIVACLASSGGIAVAQTGSDLKQPDKSDYSTGRTMTPETKGQIQPQGWTGFRRRIDRMMLAEVGWPPSERPQVFVCGPTLLVESAASAMVDLGHDPARVKTERFGPTGGSA